MSLQKPTIVLFDMDGTTVRHLNPRLLHLLERLDDVAHKSARLVSRIFRRRIESPPIVGFKNGKRKKLLVHRAIHKMRRKEVDRIVEPCPGIYDVLDLLQANDIPMAITSNGLGKGYGHDILEKFDLERYFRVAVFREDISRAKPHPDPILLALERMGVTLGEDDVVWFIGDRGKDIKAALAARDHLPCAVEPIAYTLNAAMAALEHNIGTDHIIMAWQDLETKLRKFFRASPPKKEGNGKTPEGEPEARTGAASTEV